MINAREIIVAATCMNYPGIYKYLEANKCAGGGL